MLFSFVGPGVYEQVIRVPLRMQRALNPEEPSKTI